MAGSPESADMEESETILRLPPPPVSSEYAVSALLGRALGSSPSTTDLATIGTPAPAPARAAATPPRGTPAGAKAEEEIEDGNDLPFADDDDDDGAGAGTGVGSDSDAIAEQRSREPSADGEISDDDAGGDDADTDAEGDLTDEGDDADADDADADDADADDADADDERDEADDGDGDEPDASAASADADESGAQDPAAGAAAPRAGPPAESSSSSAVADAAPAGESRAAAAATTSAAPTSLAPAAPAARPSRSGRAARPDDSASSPLAAALFPEPPLRAGADERAASASEDRERVSSRDDTEAAQHDILFAELARLEGFVSAEQVAEALRIQQQLELRGRRKRLGKIMVKLRYMTATQAKYVLRLQRQKDPIEGYKLLERRGQGGMGVVYRAVQKSLKREVAVKILSPRYAQERRFLQRFFQEAKLSAELNHANIVSAIDFGESNGYYYYAMEYVDGWSVSEMLKDDGPFDGEEALDIVLQIARGLDHASKKHIVHRDIKPENILVTPDGVAKLTDLGLSKQLTSDCSLTAEGKTLGTPFYVSPELARGTRNVDTRSDIYSLGATLYHMLAGEPPFTGDNAAAIMACHIAEEPPPLRKKAPHASKVVQHLVERMMDKNPDQRYQTADELARDIAAILKGRNPFQGDKRSPGPDAPSGRVPTAKQRPVTAPRRAYQEPRDRRPQGPAPRGRGGLVAALAGGAVALAAVIVVISQLGDRSSAADPRGGSDRVEPEMTPAERERVAGARLAAARPDATEAIDRGLFDDALRLARDVVGLAQGTPVEAEAKLFLAEVEQSARPAAQIALRKAEEALKDRKPDLALEYLKDMPQLDDPAIRARADQIRAAARQR